MMMHLEEVTVEEMIRWCYNECDKLHKDLSVITFLGEGGNIRNNMNRLKSLNDTLRKMAEVEKWED